MRAVTESARWRDSAAAAVAAVLLMALAACSGGSSSASSSTGVTTTPPPPVNNVQPVMMDYGPIVNGQYVGFNNTSLHDRYHLRAGNHPPARASTMFWSIPVPPGCASRRLCVTLSLPFMTDTSNNPIGNCVQYADTTYQWGPVVKVDVQMAGEVASSVPIQIVGAYQFHRRSRRRAPPAEHPPKR